MGNHRRFDTPDVRIALASLLSACLAALLGVGDADAATPTIRVVPGPTLVVSGAGFVPRTFVRVRLAGPGIDRVVRVRSGRLGGFLARFALEKCSLTAITASGMGSRGARVPPSWFVRECPPPPPLAPGPNPDY
jgi:hypothetical protein